MPTRVVSTTDGPRLTVNALIKSPTVIPARILATMDQLFIADQLLRPADSAPSGVVQFYESTPLFAEDDAVDVAEFGEIPVARTDTGNLMTALTVKKALAVEVSQEMVNRNQVDRVNTSIQQVRNTMVKTWDAAFIAALLANPDVHSMAASVAWSDSTSKIRKDLASAIQLAVDEKMGFNPDTLVISTTTATDFLASDDVSKVFVGNIADQNPQLTRRIGTFYGLDVWQTYALPTGDALVLERKTVGGISDERPLQATPLYVERKTETWRSDVIRQSAVFIDQPKAATLITGV